MKFWRITRGEIKMCVFVEILPHLAKSIQKVIILNVVKMHAVDNPLIPDRGWKLKISNLKISNR